MLSLAVEQGVFAEAREQLTDAQSTPVAVEDQAPAASALPPLNEETRMKLTVEGALDLLAELRDAFHDPAYQAQIYKLARDVRADRKQFLANLKPVALPLQAPIIERYGFDPTPEGVREMKKAIADFTSGAVVHERIQARADETTVAMYGCMYDKCTRS